MPHVNGPPTLDACASSPWAVHLAPQYRADEDVILVAATRDRSALGFAVPELWAERSSGWKISD